MFQVEEFYSAVEHGEEICQQELIDYLKSFPRIILWGAGNLGTAVGNKLIEIGIKPTCYWDKRFETLKTCNGIPVYRLFDHGEKVLNTLVISCIVNGALGKEWPKRVITEEGKYKNFLYGIHLYEALICPMKKGDPVDLKNCTESKACSLSNCQRYIHLINGRKEEEKQELVFQVMTFVISTRCTLNCKYCGQRLHEYDIEEKKDFSLEQIKKDMDLFFDAVDFVGMVSIIGGEPLIHPKLDEIVDYCLTKSNFGVLNITTNGVGRLSDKLLKTLKNDRIKVSISRYDAFLDERKTSLIEKNITLMEKHGISYSVSNPIWNVPGSLKLTDCSKEELVQMNKNCRLKACASVKNGLFIPCSIAETILGLHLFQIEEDAIVLAEEKDLRTALEKNLSKPYYEACKYCPRETAKEIPAGEQII